MLKTIHFGTWPHGSKAGELGFILDFNGGDGSDSVDHLLRIYNFKVRSKSVFFSGAYPSDDVMETFAGSLYQRGYHITATVNGQILYPWLRYTTAIIVEKGPEPWPGFYCNELWYRMTDPNDAAPEAAPFDPKRHPHPTAYYLAFAANLELKEVYDFVEKSPQPWRILLEPKRTYHRTVWKGESK